MSKLTEEAILNIAGQVAEFLEDVVLGSRGDRDDCLAVLEVLHEDYEEE